MSMQSSKGLYAALPLSGAERPRIIAPPIEVIGEQLPANGRGISQAMTASRQQRPLVVVPGFDLQAISLGERPRRVSPPLGVGSIWTNRTSIRKVKEETTNDLLTFLTTEPNSEVDANHPRAMPVILTTPAEVETWMPASSRRNPEAAKALPDGTLKFVARAVKEDGAELSAT
jgi:putative SOS response-associated peptidase YedK